MKKGILTLVFIAALPAFAGLHCENAKRSLKIERMPDGLIEIAIASEDGQLLFPKLSRRVARITVGIGKCLLSDKLAVCYEDACHYIHFFDADGRPIDSDTLADDGLSGAISFVMKPRTKWHPKPGRSTTVRSYELSIEGSNGLVYSVGGDFETYPGAYCTGSKMRSLPLANAFTATNPFLASRERNL